MLSAKTLILGATGLLGSALVLRMKGLQLLTPTRSELNLYDESAVLNYFDRNRPEIVFMCAGRVGGIEANLRNQLSFLLDNLRIQMNLANALNSFPPAITIWVGSSCMYPPIATQPFTEDCILTGPFETSNEGYALAKYAGLVMAKTLRQTRNFKVVYPILANLYGPRDYYDVSRSHVVAALIRRFYAAKISGNPEVVVWGSGAARRELLFSEDAAELLIELATLRDPPFLVNIGVSDDISIKDLATLVAYHIGFNGTIRWDESKPEGMSRKKLDLSVINALGFSAKTQLTDGLRLAVADFIKRFSDEFK